MKSVLGHCITDSLIIVFVGRVRKIAEGHLRHVRPSVRPSVRMEQHDSLWTDFPETRYLSVLPKSAQKIQVSLNLDKNSGYLYVDQYTVLIIARSVLLRMRNVSEKKVVEKIKTHFCVQ